MATLMSAMLTLLGQDLDDVWSSTTTGAGNANKLTLEDTTLYEKVADWVNDGMIIYITSGTDIGATRVVDSLSGSTLTVKTAFSALIASGVTYEIHRLFTRTQKLVALRNSAALLCPEVHAVVRDMTTEVVDYQHEYDISSLSLFNNKPHQVLLAQKDIEDIWVAETAYEEDDVVRPTGLSAFTGYTYICTTAGTSDTTEPTWPTDEDDTVADGTAVWTRQNTLDYSNYPMLPLHDWDITPDGYLRLNYTYTAGRKLMVVGIKPLAFSGSGAAETIALDSPFTYTLSAQAALYLCQQRTGSAPSQDVARWQERAQHWTQELALRKIKYPMLAPDGTLITGPGLTT
uniref:Putative tail protein n=1 Tax=viral metagenome TaxID=1070528 RepID=A0A6M3JEG3_9ZZZZ